jgi:molybdate/tungstate transport system substrate-binding protein
MNAIKAISSLMVLVMIFLTASCTNSANAPSTREIRVIHAGSLSIPFKEMAGAFIRKYPEYDVLLEAYGSRTCARQITDLKRQVDVMASADSAVIRDMLMPRYADFCIDFTTNEMVIMFTEKSRYADVIDSQNWYELLLKPDVQYGHSDPNSDPCGYRALLTWQLAEKYYRSENLYQRLRENMPAKNLRPKEVDLIALLEGGEVDYIFIYRSVAEQHRAKYLLLPEEINLKSPELADYYRNATLKITGSHPGEEVEVKGEAMVYGITMPKNAPHPQGALRFLSFVLGAEGQAIMKKNGQPEIIPPRVDYKEKLPDALKAFFKE